MNEEDILTSSSMIIDDPNRDVDGVLATVNSIIDESVRERSVQVALRGVKGILRIVKASGMGLIHFTAGIRNNWESYDDVDPEEKDFVAWYHRETGLNQRVIERHLTIYDQIIDNNEVPEDIKPLIMARNIKDLVPVSYAMRDGFFFSNDEWKKIATAGNFTEVSRIVRSTRDMPPRKSSKVVALNPDGTLNVYNEGKRYPVGYLDVSSKEQVVQDIITRIINSSGIIRR